MDQPTFRPPPSQAATQAGGSTRRFDSGNALSTVFRVYFANIGPFVALTAMALTPMFLYSIVRITGWSPGTDELSMLLWDAGATLILTGLATPFATAMVVYGVFQQLRGRHASFGDCVSVGLMYLLPVFGVSILSGLAIYFGLMMCLVPGFIFWVMFFVAVPAAVEERPGIIASLERSAKLTEGYRWHVFGVVAALVGINWITNQITAVLGTGGVPLMISTAISAFTTALSATAAAVVYYQLRSVKEAVDIDQIATVFD